MLIKQEDFKNYFDEDTKRYVFPNYSSFLPNSVFAAGSKFGNWCINV